MADQPAGNQRNTISLARALFVPIFALLFALLLIYTRPPPGEISPTHWVSIPANWGGEFLRNGLRNIAITLGLSCFPGAIIGAGLGWLIDRNTKLASGSIFVLRVGQWAPFLLSPVLTWALFYPSSQRPDREFYVWTVAIPAVALGSCYQILAMRTFAVLDWHRSSSAVAGLAFQRAVFISIVLSLSVWIPYWAIHPANENWVRHYVSAGILMLFLFIANWATRSDIYQSAVLREQLIINDVLPGNRGTVWPATLMVAAAGVAWQLLSELGYLPVSAFGVVSAIPKLFVTWDIATDISTSMVEIVVGSAVSGLLVLIVYPFFSPNERCHRWTLPLFSLTAGIPMILLPAWHHWVLTIGRPTTFESANFLAWEATCVATLSFFPLLQTLWTLHNERRATKVLLAVEQALPYGFAAILYGEMMSATSGLGFAVVMATGRSQLEKASAIFLVFLSLLLVLSTTLRLLVKRFFPPLLAQPLIND
jgi:ABC-type nitrate/sulfonate/bicarbonate transport system permease component